MIFFKLIRLSHWIKNFILFIPCILDKSIFDKWPEAMQGFFSFGLIASAGYIYNDLLDVESDRNHPVKRYRPIASGEISCFLAILILIVFLFLALIISYIIDVKLVYLIVVYIILHILYSRRLKRIAYFDLLFLTSFYMVRLFFGAETTNTELTGWLVVFVFFSTFSLSIEKRYAELVVSKKDLIHRGYAQMDSLNLNILKFISVFLSLLVLNIHGFLVLHVTTPYFYAFLNLFGMGLIISFFKKQSDDDLIKKIINNWPLLVFSLFLFLMYLTIIYK